MALLSCVRITRLVAVGTLAWLALRAADNAQLLAEFRKTKPDAAQVHMIAKTPLVVATTGGQQWMNGELLGVFGHRGAQIVPIAILPNTDSPRFASIENESADSVTIGFSEYADTYHYDKLKVFFDPTTFFPKRMVQFTPVQVRQITVPGGVVTVTGSDGKQEFVARERNGSWRVTIGPTAPVPAPKSIETELKVDPEKAKQFPQIAEENIGPYQKVGNRIWVGKAFAQPDGGAGVGDIGYFDTASQDWTFLHIREMADWSASALLVEPAAIWVGLVHIGADGNASGGLLRYDRTRRQATKIALRDEIDKIVRIG